MVFIATRRFCEGLKAAPRRQAVLRFCVLLTTLSAPLDQTAFGSCPNFVVNSVYGAPTRPISVAMSDFNSDGRSDLAVANVLSDNVSILLGNGDGTFRVGVQYAVGSR